MPELTLRGYRILVVEDDYLLADELQSELEDAAAVVLGPIGRLEDALDLIGSAQHIDAAILDLNLGGETTYSAADRLIERGVPFVFTTGYDGSAIPSRFVGVARCLKPVDMRQLTQTIGRAIRA